MNRLTHTPCRRHMMVAAVAATVMMLTLSPAAQAQAPAEKPAVSAAEIAAAKAEVDKLSAMSSEERMKYLEEQRAANKNKPLAEREAEMRARKAYMASLPEADRKKMHDRIKADREAMQAKKKAEWEAMTPAQKEAFKKERKAKYEEKMKNMTPEERAKFEKMKEQRKAKKAAEKAKPE